MQGYNKISSNFSKNQFSTSVYDAGPKDTCLGKKKSSAMEVMEFAKMFKNKGEDSPSFNKGLANELKNGRTKNSGIPLTGNNLEYRDLKNFNWIKDQMNQDVRPVPKFDRP